MLFQPGRAQSLDVHGAVFLVNDRMTFLDPFHGQGWVQASRLGERVSGGIMVVGKAGGSRQRSPRRAEMWTELDRPSLAFDGLRKASRHEMTQPLNGQVPRLGEIARA